MERKFSDMGLFTKIFGTYSDHELKKIYPIADQIEALEEEYKALTDAQLQAKTAEFKARLQNGETTDDILPEAFAAVREAADRVLGMRPYRVQLIGGIVLHQGRIAEMKTGEGKTQVATLPAYLNALGEKCGVIGTIHYDLGGRCLPASRTTPDALELHAMLNQMRNASCRAAAMEISSHSIAQKRVKGVHLDCACFLNLTQDHMDYHKTMESYFETKASMFTGALGALPKNAVLNFDDPHGREIAKRLDPSVKAVGFGIESPDAQIRAENLELLPDGSKFKLVWPEGEMQTSIKMTGHYNVSNALAALACIYAAGFDIKKAAEILANFGGVPGRMQKVSGNAGFDIFVDYAHTDDALKNGLSMLRKVVKNRLLVVFGCGGKRDRTKRPKMMKAVQEYADFAWATSDNPRGEPIAQIFDDMKKGISDPSKVVFVEDRRRAINLAIDSAQKGDCILIAGKGHETFQELGDTIIPFDDKRVAEELLTLKGLI